MRFRKVPIISVLMEKRLHETPPPILILSQKRTRTELTSLSNRERSMRAFIFRLF